MTPSQSTRATTASPFTDIRVVHAPLPVTFALLKDYLEGHGFDFDGRELPSHANHLIGTARSSMSVGRRLLHHKPGVVNFELNSRRGGSTQVQLYISYGKQGEIVLALIATMLWAALGFGWWRLLAMRHEFLPDGRFSYVSPIVPAFGFGLCLVVAFTVTWFTAFRLNIFVSRFYKYISGEGGVSHFAESPQRLPFAGFVQVLIVNSGLFFICCVTLELMPMRERMIAAIILLSLFAVATLLLLVGPGAIRWVIGHAAFTSAISCSLYVWLPLIVFALSLKEIQQAATGTGVTGYQISALLVLAFTVGLIFKAVSHTADLARNIDYWRQHVEAHRWMTCWRRVALGLIAIPFLAGSGFLILIAAGHSLLFLQGHLLGDYALPHAVGFDQAAESLGLLAAPFLGTVGLQSNPITLGNGIFSLYLLPVVGWCACHVVAFFRDVIHYVRLLRLPKPPNDSPLHAILFAQAIFGMVRTPKIRLLSSPHLKAFTPIPPFLFLPQLVVVSTKAIEKLPHRCVVALLAHEMGHLRHRHTETYSCLRLLSRVLLLGPSVLTGLIKPAAVLEVQADSFATRWLEMHNHSRQDLINVIDLLEENKIASFLSATKQAGLAIKAGSDWLPPWLRSRLENISKQGKIQQMITNWRLLHFMTFESDLANYVYFSHAERVALINALPVTSSRHESKSA